MPVLETPRLLLRPLQPDDAEAAFRWCGDPAVNRYMRYALYQRAEDIIPWLEEAAASPYEFGFVRRADGLLIGSGGVTPGDAENEPWELGYNLRRDCWGHGYATEAAMAMLDYARKTFGIRDFIAYHAKANPASGRVMEKCGFLYQHDGEYSRFDGSETFPARFYTLRIN